MAHCPELLTVVEQRNMYFYLIFFAGVPSGFMLNITLLEIVSKWTRCKRNRMDCWLRQCATVVSQMSAQPWIQLRNMVHRKPNGQCGTWLNSAAHCAKHYVSSHRDLQLQMAANRTQTIPVNLLKALINLKISRLCNNLLSMLWLIYLVRQLFQYVRGWAMVGSISMSQLVNTRGGPISTSSSLSQAPVMCPRVRETLPPRCQWLLMAISSTSHNVNPFLDPWNVAPKTNSNDCVVLHLTDMPSG